MLCRFSLIDFSIFVLHQMAIRYFMASNTN